MSGHATIDTAVEATRIGAVDFLEKPITLQRLLKTIGAALARGRITPPVVAPAVAATPAAPAAAPASAPAVPAAAGAAPAAAVAATPAGNGVPAAPSPAPAPSPVLSGLLGSISLDQPLREARDAFERIYFEYHLGRESHSMTRVSEKTGLERTHLYRKLKQLGIESARKRGS